MGRPLRVVLPECPLEEVTNRTLEGRYFLRPSPQTNEVLLGVFAKAVVEHAMGVVGFNILSNHQHLLLLPEDAEHLSGFMRDFNGNAAREVNRLLGRSGPFWHRRYHNAGVSCEEAKQVERLRYLLAQGVKENLVASPREWPGVTATPYLLRGEPVRGIWFDRTAEARARRRGERFDRYEYAREYSFELQPPPAWKDLSPEELRARIEELCREIEAEARKARSQSGKPPLGATIVCQQDPLKRPRSFQPTPAPRFHAATAEMRVMLEAAYRSFRDLYREAAAALRAGRPGPDFPAGSFPPPLPFARGRPPPRAAPA